MGWKALRTCFSRWINTDTSHCLEEHGGFAPTSFAKRNFQPRTEREYVLTPVQSILRAGVGRPAGMWKAQPSELGIEPGALAARVFPSPEDCKVFVLLLSLSHSFISNETYWFTVRWRGKNNPAITKCRCETEKLFLTQLSSKKNLREEVRAAARSLPVGHEGAAHWWSMPGIPPPWCRTGPGNRSQGEVAQRCETQEEKSYIKVINESKSALCKGAGSRGNLSVW